MKSVIGIDIGGTITKIGIVSKGTDVLKKTSFRTKDYKDFSSYTDKIHSSIININNNIEILELYYLITIELESEFFESKGKMYPLLPGIQVTCSIRTGDRSVLEYLIGPFMNIPVTALRER